jgi:hypothetical protein
MPTGPRRRNSLQHKDLRQLKHSVKVRKIGSLATKGGTHIGWA